MKRESLVAGSVGGLLGGMVMAMWSMIVLWMLGVGFWTPLNLIAHTFWRDIPTDATFSVSGLIIGGAVHMMMSIILGVMLALLAEQVPATPNVLLLGGMGYGLVVWLINQYIIWPVVDPTAATAFTPWVFAVGHLMYGVVAAAALLPQLRTRATGLTRPQTA
jgi:uncharacterized membrane protein YagU involved in acid resistance